MCRYLGVQWEGDQFRGQGRRPQGWTLELAEKSFCWGPGCPLSRNSCETNSPAFCVTSNSWSAEIVLTQKRGVRRTTGKGMLSGGRLLNRPLAAFGYPPADRASLS